MTGTPSSGRLLTVGAASTREGLATPRSATHWAAASRAAARKRTSWALFMKVLLAFDLGRCKREQSDAEIIPRACASDGREFIERGKFRTRRQDAERRACRTLLRWSSGRAPSGSSPCRWAPRARWLP